jgi:hypothetical protein
MTTTTLFDITPTPKQTPGDYDPLKHAHADGPESSKAGARQVAPHADSQCDKMLAKLREGPIRNTDLAEWCLGNHIMGMTARISDLRMRGYIVDAVDNVYILRTSE